MKGTMRGNREHLAQRKTIMQPVNGWLLCPLCGKRLIRVSDNTMARNLTLYCKRCRKEIPNISFDG